MNNFTYGIEFAIVSALGIAVIIYHYRDIKKDEKILDQKGQIDEAKIKSDIDGLTDDQLDEILASRDPSQKPKA